jgi:hypothetical protein
VTGEGIDKLKYAMAAKVEEMRREMAIAGNSTAKS